MALFYASGAHVLKSTLRSGSRAPPFSARHSRNLNSPGGVLFVADRLRHRFAKPDEMTELGAQCVSRSHVNLLLWRNVVLRNLGGYARHDKCCCGQYEGSGNAEASFGSGLHFYLLAPRRGDLKIRIVFVRKTLDFQISEKSRDA
jgi:hypothetical protein